MPSGDSLPRPIFTLTLNPAIDEAITTDQLTLGGTNRSQLDALDPGGKGLNASRVIWRLGRPTVAFGFVGGVTGDMIRARLNTEGVPHQFGQVSDLTRLNMMIYERGTGRRTRIYLPGAGVEPSQLVEIREHLAEMSIDGVVILGGSLPPGLPTTTYRDLVTWLKERGIRTIVDTSGAALEAVLGAEPTLIKPNVEEVAEILGRELLSDQDILEAARELRARGPENVVISQGAQGAIGISRNDEWKAVPPLIVARSTVGSGDSMVAGLAIALNEGHGLPEGLRLGTATGAATATTPGTHLCQLDGVDRLLPLVRVDRLTERANR